MVQEFQVLQCFACKCFQVHQVKKSKKWVCKLCGEKQSFLKSYGQGSGADCRHHVQKLNLMRGEIVQETEMAAWSLGAQENVNKTAYSEQEEGSGLQKELEPSVSRWSKYVGKSSEEPPEEGAMLYMDRQQFSLDLKNPVKEPRKRKKTFQDDFDENVLTSKTKKANWCKSWNASTTVTEPPLTDVSSDDFRDPSPAEVLVTARSPNGAVPLYKQSNATASKWGKFVHSFKDSASDTQGGEMMCKAQEKWTRLESGQCGLCRTSFHHVVINNRKGALGVGSPARVQDNWP
ncbi:MRN complex-interacting protein [Rhinatrema bivittatum]|uniref:MRN complex-interacting protein n=1 Tax=Rhinatrema bivittatum TaxID=194408 RepID=UPI0011272859|nr:MRN complex-interacting protein [Rhinatrema bivittatum]